MFNAQYQNTDSLRPKILLYANCDFSKNAEYLCEMFSAFCSFHIFDIRENSVAMSMFVVVTSSGRKIALFFNEHDFQVSKHFSIKHPAKVRYRIK